MREARKNETKAQIFRKAIELFREKGYENVTVEEIASACGMAKGTFFNYFPKKEHVLLHWSHSQLSMTEAVVGRYRDRDMKSRLRLIFGELLQPYREQGELLKVTLSETMRSALLMKEESSSIDAFQRTLAGAIDEAKEAGEFRSAWDSGAIASVLVAIYFKTLITWSVDSASGEDVAERFNAQLDVVWHGIEGTAELTQE